MLTETLKSHQLYVYRLEIQPKRKSCRYELHLSLGTEGWIFVNPLNQEVSLCDKEASEALYSYMKHEKIEYPKDLKEAMLSLWQLAREKPLEAQEIQYWFNRIGHWIGAYN